MSDRYWKRRLQVGAVRKKAQRCLRQGSYRLGTPHMAKDVMPEREIILNDLFNVVLSVDAEIEAEWDEKYEEWRYNFTTERFTVVVTFEAPNRIVFITAWRLKRNPN